jgi:hypothetical protein
MAKKNKQWSIKHCTENEIRPKQTPPKRGLYSGVPER